MRQSPIMVLLLVLALIMPMAGCVAATIKADDGRDIIFAPSDLADTAWVLEGYGDTGALTMALNGTRITLAWNENADGISGHSGVNIYWGSALIQNNLLTIGGIIQTEMASLDPDVMAQEAAYLTLLGQAQSWEVADKLIITCADGAVLVYRKDESIPTLLLSDLANTSWKLTSIGVGELVSSVLMGTGVTPTLIFNEDATRVGGMGGVNSYSGECRINGADITISNIVQTMMFSDDPPGILGQENNFFDLLGKAENFEAKTKTFTIYCQGGRFLVFMAVQ